MMQKSVDVAIKIYWKKKSDFWVQSAKWKKIPKKGEIDNDKASDRDENTRNSDEKRKKKLMYMPA